MNGRIVGLVALLGLTGCASVERAPVNVPVQVSVNPEYKGLQKFTDGKCPYLSDSNLAALQEMKMPVSFIEEALKDIDETGSPRDVPLKRTRDITGQLTGDPILDAMGCPERDMEKLIARYRLRSF